MTPYTQARASLGSFWEDLSDRVKATTIIVGAVATIGSGTLAADEIFRGLPQRVQALEEKVDSIIVGEAVVMNRLDRLDTGQEFLICDRRRRRAELTGDPWTRNCEDEFQDDMLRR